MSYSTYRGESSRGQIYGRHPRLARSYARPSTESLRIAYPDPPSQCVSHLRRKLPPDVRSRPVSNIHAKRRSSFLRRRPDRADISLLVEISDVHHCPPRTVLSFGAICCPVGNIPRRPGLRRDWRTLVWPGGRGEN